MRQALFDRMTSQSRPATGTDCYSLEHAAWQDIHWCRLLKTQEGSRRKGNEIVVV